MCDPVTLGITVASTLAKSYFENKAAEEVSDAQLASQRTFDKDLKTQRNKANVQFQDSTQQAGKTVQDARQEQAVESRNAASQPSFNQNVLLPGQGDANNAVRTAVVNAQNEGIAKNADLATRRANLDAFGDADLGTNIALLQNANRIKTAGNMAGGAYPVLQADLGAAAHAGDSSSTISDIIGGLGQIGAIATGVDWGGFGASDPLTKNAAGQTVGTFNVKDIQGPPSPFAKPDKNPFTF